MSPIKDYQGPLLGNQTPQGPAYGKCPTCGNIMFDEACSYCEALTKVAPKALPQAEPPRMTMAEADAEAEERVIIVTLRDLGTLGIGALLVEGDQQARATGESAALAIVNAMDVLERPVLTEEDVVRFTAAFRQADANLDDIIQEVARAAVARAREGQ